MDYKIDFLRQTEWEMITSELLESQDTIWSLGYKDSLFKKTREPTDRTRRLLREACIDLRRSCDELVALVQLEGRD